MPLKKSELYSSLWSSCDELRGGMDASQYKDYVLVLLFVKYISDKYAGKHSRLVLSVRPGATEEKKREVLERWYRDQIREITPRLIAKWERIIGVRVQDFHVQRMKTKWGSCSARTGTIRLNSELARKPRECLEYIVVHEMVHLLERTHNRRFVSLMDQFMPRWKSHRELLNRLPVRREKWDY